MKSTGKTGEKLVIKVPSVIVRTGWLDDRVAAGGKIGLEVHTRLVADGSPIQIDLRTVSGKKIAVHEGKVYADTHRRIVPVPADIEEDIVFQAKLSEHKLEQVSPKVHVAAGLRIAETKWFDDSGKELDHLQDGTPALGKAKILGRPDGTKVLVSVMLTETNGGQRLVKRAEATIKDRAIEVHLDWQYGEKAKDVPKRAERDRHGQAYTAPTVGLHVICDGIEADGPKIPVTQEMVLKYQTGTGVAGAFEGKKVTVTAPDGQKTEHDVPADGVVRIPKTKPGHYEIEHPKLDDPPARK